MGSEENREMWKGGASQMATFNAPQRFTDDCVDASRQRRKGCEGRGTEETYQIYSSPTACGEEMGSSGGV